MVWSSSGESSGPSLQSQLYPFILLVNKYLNTSVIQINYMCKTPLGCGDDGGGPILGAQCHCLMGRQARVPPALV